MGHRVCFGKIPRRLAIFGMKPRIQFINCLGEIFGEIHLSGKVPLLTGDLRKIQRAVRILPKIRELKLSSRK